MADIKYEIKETVGVIAESAKGWKKELNLISWNGKDAKYDLREWAPGHEKMGKGITLTVDELKSLKEVLTNMDIQVLMESIEMQQLLLKIKGTEM